MKVLSAKGAPSYLISLSAIIALLAMAFWIDMLFGYVRTEQPGVVVWDVNETPGGKVWIVMDSGRVDTVKYQLDPTSQQPDKEKDQALSELNSSAFINLSPSVLTWIFFLSSAIGISLGLVPFLFWQIGRLIRQFQVKGMPSFWITSIATIIAGLVTMIWVHTKRPVLMDGVEIMETFGIIFNDPSAATTSVIYPLMLVGLLPLFGIAAIYSVITRAFDADNAETDKEEAYKSIKGYLNVFTLMAALLISCAVISTGMQRDMILDQLISAEALYPQKIIYIYGASFSVLLALFAIPAYAYLQYAASDHLPQTANEDGSKNWWKIGQQSIDNLKTALSIVLPLLTSIIQPLLG